MRNIVPPWSGGGAGLLVSLVTPDYGTLADHCLVSPDSNPSPKISPRCSAKERSDNSGVPVVDTGSLLPLAGPDLVSAAALETLRDTVPSKAPDPTKFQRC